MLKEEAYSEYAGSKLFENSALCERAEVFPKNERKSIVAGLGR
jgi:hypothetical protein